MFAFWVDLAERLGLGDEMPWKTLEEMLDHRAAPMGLTYEEAVQTFGTRIAPHRYRSYRRTGFGTPSGKVELSSSVLAELGMDPLPYYREPPRDPAYPFNVSIGVREDPYFQTGQRQLPSLRRISPLPKIFIHPDDGAKHELADGDWVRVSTPHGSVSGVAELRTDMLPGHLRVPHGWWFPELIGSVAGAGADQHNDGMLINDTAEHLDREQGVPHFKGFAGRLERLEVPPEHMAGVQHLSRLKPPRIP